MPRQLVLDLPFRAAMGRADFFVTTANADAVAGIEDWRSWPGGKVLLLGPHGSGKTHLAHVFATLAGATILQATDLAVADPTTLAEGPALAVEDADTIAGDSPAEEALFHLHNACADRGRTLLLTAATPPQHWGLALPDLQSRIQQAGQLTLAPPDDTLLAAVLVKLSADRQMMLTPRLVAYILPRIDRSLDYVQRFVTALDAEALATRKRPGTQHVRAVLDRLAR